MSHWVTVQMLVLTVDKLSTDVSHKIPCSLMTRWSFVASRSVVVKRFSWVPGKKNSKQAATQCDRGGVVVVSNSRPEGGGVQTKNVRAATQRDPVPQPGLSTTALT